MNLRRETCFLLTLLCCSVIAALPAAAQQTVYENGPIDGHTDGWAINNGFYVDDTFYVSSPSEQVTGMSFGVWLTPGDVLQSVEVTITSEPDYGTFYFDGVATPTASGCFLNSYSFDVCKETVSFGGGPFLDTGSYWVTLKNAVVTGGDPVYWDENRGVGCDSPGCPSVAKENGNEGSIPSESFTMLGATGTGTGSSPEPSNLLLFGSGVAGAIGVLRRRIF
jgi:PEP-CTERM motif